MVISTYRFKGKCIVKTSHLLHPSKRLSPYSHEDWSQYCLIIKSILNFQQILAIRTSIQRSMVHEQTWGNFLATKNAGLNIKNSQQRQISYPSAPVDDELKGDMNTSTV